MLRDIERLAATYLPKRLVDSLQGMKRKLPFRLDQADPVVQTYINDGRTRSFAAIHNFYSYLLADVETEARAEFRFYDSAGRAIKRHQEWIPHFGSKMIDIASLLGDCTPSSEVGIVTAQLTPRWPRRPVYRELGRVSAQFFVFYYDASGSVEQVHPLSTADPKNSAGATFFSSQLLTTNQLAQIQVFQYNPARQPQKLEHRLLDADSGRVVRAHACELAAMGATRTTFELDQIRPLPERVSLVVDRLPSPNAKPMIRRVFKSGLHSMSHA